MAPGPSWPGAALGKHVVRLRPGDRDRPLVGGKMVARRRQSREKAGAVIGRAARIATLLTALLIIQRVSGHEDIDTEVKNLTDAGYKEIKAGNFDAGIADFRRCLELKPKNASSAY